MVDTRSTVSEAYRMMSNNSVAGRYPTSCDRVPSTLAIPLHSLRPPHGLEEALSVWCRLGV